MSAEVQTTFRYILENEEPHGDLEQMVIVMKEVPEGCNCLVVDRPVGVVTCVHGFRKDENDMIVEYDFNYLYHDGGLTYFLPEVKCHILVLTNFKEHIGKPIELRYSKIAADPNFDKFLRERANK
jgi:hypothetical protein